MKVTLNFEDLAQNMRQLNEFLDKKGLSAVYGGQGNTAGTEGNGEYEDTKPIYPPYSQKIYPNYCESTYVNYIIKP